MVEPSRRTSRLTLATSALALIAVGAGGFALGRGTMRTPPPPAPAPVPAAAEPPQASTLPELPGPLGRADLLEAAARAADALSAGRPLPDPVSALAGRAFELRLPFGCSGPSLDPAAPLGWSFDGAAGTLRVRAQPVRWPPAEWLPARGDAPLAETVEGFWVNRPWSMAETCAASSAPTPAVSEPTAPERAAPEPETVGIAEFFPPGASRVGRRDGKAFEAVEKVAADALDSSRGFRLRLRGRLVASPDGRVVLCRAPNPDVRPQCLLSVTLDEVAVENGATDETVATWDVASQTSDTARPN
jgi:hypothetical protein